MTDDNELVFLYTEKNDEQAFNTLYEKYQPFKYSMIKRYKNSINLDVEDIAAEIDVAFLHSVKKFNYKQKSIKFFTFLINVCTNHLNNIYKKNKPKFIICDINYLTDDETNDIDLLIDEEDVISNLIDKISEEDLKAYITDFFYKKDVCKTNIDIFIDYYFNKMSQKEIADKYNLKKGNISDRLTRLKKYMKTGGFKI